jgi:tetratricopeptide (TPR) repeat protein
MHVRSYLFTLICVLFSTIQLEAQSYTTQIELKNAQTDTQRVRLLCDLSFEYLNTKVDSAMYYAQEALRIAQNDQYDDGASRSLNAIGNVLLQTGQHDKALETYLAALKKSRNRKI